MEMHGLNEALAVLDADDLRELVRRMVRELDEDAAARVVDLLLERAARKAEGAVQNGPDEAGVAEIVGFAALAMRQRCAELRSVDAYLRRGTDAFLARDYEAARRVFQAWFPPLADGRIDLGQRESVDEVLGVDLGRCIARYVTAVYLTSEAEARPAALVAAIRGIGELHYCSAPIGAMESVAVEPLAGLDDFLPRWRALVAEVVGGPNSLTRWSSGAAHWMQEVVQRLEGPAGLASHARATRRGDDLRVWCRGLVETKQWQAALAAFDEAAELVQVGSGWRAQFLDGGALAARELGGLDLTARLERAWRESSNMTRLRRWLGAERSEVNVREIAEKALEACPEREGRQRALLDLVLADFDSAAQRLQRAPGLGWSRGEHPGSLVFQAFAFVLVLSVAPLTRVPLEADPDVVEHDWISHAAGVPPLEVPAVTQILATAGVLGPVGGETRAALLSAMREAAEKRVEGVTSQLRRRHYGHAAQLVATCAVLDPTPAGVAWVSSIRSRFGRYPALQAEFNVLLGKRRDTGAP